MYSTLILIVDCTFFILLTSWFENSLATQRSTINKGIMITMIKNRNYKKTGHKHKIFLYSSCPFFISPLLTVLYYRMNVKKPIHCKKQVKDFSVSLTYHSFNFKSITRFAHLIILKHECIMMICLTCHNTFLIYGFRGISCFF